MQFIHGTLILPCEFVVVLKQSKATEYSFASSAICWEALDLLHLLHLFSNVRKVYHVSLNGCGRLNKPGNDS